MIDKIRLPSSETTDSVPSILLPSEQSPTKLQPVHTVPGLVYIESFIQPTLEAELMASIDQQHQQWITELKRRVQHYGYRYNYKAHLVTSEDYLGPLPDWLRALAEKLTTTGLLLDSPDQAIINEYTPGQGISKHIDCPNCFGSQLATISLGSPCIMYLRRQQLRHDLLLQRCSVLVLSGDARKKYLTRVGAS
jgi:alkylated DNA repair dioxygenase AlkB